MKAKPIRRYYLNENTTKYIIGENDSLIMALNIIETSGVYMALVVGSNGQLQGLVNDSDIRKHFLNNGSLEATVQSIMNRSPHLLYEGYSESEFISATNEGHRRYVPLVSKDKNVVGLFTKGYLGEKNELDNLVVIMVGGEGKRLRPFTTDIPKPMLKIAEMPLLEIIVRRLQKQGFHNYVFATNYLKEKIIQHFGDGEEYGVNISYLFEDKKLGTAGCLSQLKGKVEKPFIVINGDVLTKADLSFVLEYHENENVTATIGSSQYDISVPYGVLECDGNTVTDMIEKPVYKYMINAGIYILNPDVLDCIPDDSNLDMPDLMKLILSNGKQVQTYPIVEYWLDIGCEEDYLRANNEYRKYF